MEFTRLEEVRAGWSGDRKYHAWDDGGKEFFLRLSQPEKWEKAQSAFALQEKAFQLGLPVSEPIELAQEEGQVRFVERWLSGQMAEGRTARPAPRGAVPPGAGGRGNPAGAAYHPRPGRSRGLGEPVQPEDRAENPAVPGVPFPI